MLQGTHKSICFTLPGVPEPHRVFERSLDHLKALHSLSGIANTNAWIMERHWHTYLPLRVLLLSFCFLSPKASQLIVSFDEHEVNNTFKFGVIYQKFGQVRVVLSSFLHFIYFDWIFSVSHCYCLFTSDVRGRAVRQQWGDACLCWIPQCFRRQYWTAGF